MILVLEVFFSLICL